LKFNICGSCSQQQQPATAAAAANVKSWWIGELFDNTRPFGVIIFVRVRVRFCVIIIFCTLN
jgi:hypothetical protein